MTKVNPGRSLLACVNSLRVHNSSKDHVSPYQIREANVYTMAIIPDKIVLTDGRTDRWSAIQTDGQPSSIVPPKNMVVGVYLRRHKQPKDSSRYAKDIL